MAPLRQRHLGVWREGVGKVVDITLRPLKAYVLPRRTRHNIKRRGFRQFTHIFKDNYLDGMSKHTIAALATPGTMAESAFGETSAWWGV